MTIIPGLLSSRQGICGTITLLMYSLHYPQGWNIKSSIKATVSNVINSKDHEQPTYC